MKIVIFKIIKYLNYSDLINLRKIKNAKINYFIMKIIADNLSKYENKIKEFKSLDDYLTICENNSVNIDYEYIFQSEVEKIII